MKSVIISFLSFFMILKASLVADLPPPTSPIVEERHELFMLAVLSYLYCNLERSPKPGHDIGALIAWDVEDVDHTPEFVIDCNRNLEKQGSIFHAEIMAIEKALLKKHDPSISDTMLQTERYYNEVRDRLANATLYSSLEPCPFCTMGISWSRISKVLYFMDDPQMRDSATYNPLISFPEVFYSGRHLAKFSSSSLTLAVTENQKLRNVLLQDPPGKHITIGPDGKKILDFRKYFEERKETLFKSAFEQFSSYEVHYDQNRELFRNLVEMIRSAA